MSTQKPRSRASLALLAEKVEDMSEEKLLNVVQRLQRHLDQTDGDGSRYLRRKLAIYRNAYSDRVGVDWKSLAKPLDQQED